MSEEYKDNICLIGRNIDIIKSKLHLEKNQNKKKLEDFWNISSYEIKDNLQVNNIFDEILKVIQELIKKSTYGSKKFSYTIIYELNEISQEKKNLQNLIKKLLTKLKNNYYNQPFIILLANNQQDKDELELFLKEYEIFEYDKRNISCYISPININSSSDDSEIIRRKIDRIFSYYFGLGDEFEIKGQKFKIYN